MNRFRFNMRFLLGLVAVVAALMALLKIGLDQTVQQRNELAVRWVGGGAHTREGVVYGADFSGVAFSSRDAGIIAGISSIEELRLYNCQIDDIQFGTLCNLELELLWLEGTTISNEGIANCGYIPTLRVLSLSRTGVTTLDGVSACESLERLLVNGSNVDDAGTMDLSSLHNLRELGLSGTNVGDATALRLSSLSQLEELDLRDTAITDEGLRYLARSPSLRTLALNGTRITDKGLLRLAEAPALEALSLADTSVTDEGLEHLALLPKLRYLALSGSQAAGRGFTSWNEKSDLEHLRLARLKLAPEAFAHITKWTSLKRLDLQGSSITGDGILELQQARGLTFIDLRGANIDASLVETLRQSLPSVRIEH